MIYGFFKTAAGSPETSLCDCRKNAESIKKLIDEAKEGGAVLLVLPRLSLTGVGCGDLFRQQRLLLAAEGALIDLAEYTADKDIAVVVGVPLMIGDGVYDCAAVLCNGTVCGVCPSTDAPYPFDSWRGGEKKHVFYGFGLENEYDVPVGSGLVFGDPEYELRFCADVGREADSIMPPSLAAAASGANVVCALSDIKEISGAGEALRSAAKERSNRLAAGYIAASCGDGESTTDMVFGGRCIICENGSVLAENAPLERGGSLIFSEIDCRMLISERQKRGFSKLPRKENGFVDIGHIDCADTVLTRKIPRSPFNPDKSADLCRDIMAAQAAALARRVEAARAPGCVIGVSGGLDSTLALIASVKAMERLGRPASCVTAVTMPCFGTTSRTRTNADVICERLGVTYRCVDIKASVDRHFADIGHDPAVHSAVYENAQARERTQVLMDIANGRGDIVVGTGDLSELALGWATYNGDHMSMYGVNGSLPKTLIRDIVGVCADDREKDDPVLSAALRDILATPVSPELLPSDGGSIAQKTEDLVGPYELHDFFIYYFIRFGFEPEKIRHITEHAFCGEYGSDTISKWLDVFLRRFFSMQFKRSCMPDGPDLTGVSLSPRGGWSMPSDAPSDMWRR